MNNNEPNKIVAALYKDYLKISLLPTGDYLLKIEPLKEKLQSIASVVGAIEVMSKNNIIKLVRMQSSLRFMQHHTFYMQFAIACQDMFEKK